MTDLVSLRDALLELGLEDLIPLPEIRATPEVRELAERHQQVEQVAAALVELLREGRIQVWAGHWADEPAVVSREVAETMLRDERRYSFDAEASGLARVYFANVENLSA